MLPLGQAEELADLYPGEIRHVDDGRRDLLEAGDHKDLVWGEVGNLVAEAADRMGHPWAACSRGHGKGQSTDHGEGEDGNTELGDPTDASCHSPCEIWTSERDCDSHHLVLGGISLDCDLCRDFHGHDGDSFHDLFHGLYPLGQTQKLDPYAAP